jgi:hypothetical protein
MVFTPVFVVAAVVLTCRAREPARASARVQLFGRVYVILNAGEMPPAGPKNISRRFGVFTHRGTAKAREIFPPRGGENSSYDVL